MQQQQEQQRDSHIGADENRERLVEVLTEIETGMLVTHAIGGGFHARPMMLAKGGLNSDEWASSERFLYFVTSSGSPKAREISKNDEVTLTFQDRRRFVSLNGTATLTKDPSLIARLWSDVWKVWFPAGVNDPRLCIIRVTPQDGEYWDQSGLNGLRYLFDAAVALVTKETPDEGDGQNGKVSF